MAKRPIKRAANGREPGAKKTNSVRNSTKTKRTRSMPTDQEKALREKYQRERPSLADLQASGDFEPTISQGEYWDLMRVLSRLRKLRAEAGLSLADMAKRTGMDRAAISRLENAVNDNPTLATLGRYATALGKRLVVTIADG